MSSLLVVYLFLADGKVINERYEHAAATLQDCLTLGSLRGQKLHHDNPNSDSAVMCIREGGDNGA